MKTEIPVNKKIFYLIIYNAVVVLSLISFTITRNTEKEKIAYFINFYNMSLLYTT